MVALRVGTGLYTASESIGQTVSCCQALKHE